MVLDAGLLKENLRNIPKEENQIPEECRKLKRLLLVLAGDQRTIQALSLEDIAKMFSESTWILSCYKEKMDYYFDQTKLKNYKNSGRRAV